MIRRLFTMLIFPVLLIACDRAGDAQPGSDSARGAAATQDRPFTMTEVADLDSPWAMAFLPGGELLVTEKAGVLKLLSADSRTNTEVAGTPAVDSAGQGGLMDVVTAPDFATSNRLYLSWSEAGQGGKGVVLGTARLERTDGKARLADLRPIFRARPLVSGNGHYSGRIAFAPDGEHLFFAAGDRQHMEPAQERDGTLGKVLRLDPDGGPAAGNPLADKDFDPAVWSYGHRNVLGLAFDDQGRLWASEMGPRGGDEINLILPGRNYGWPVASDGDHYDGRSIPDHAARPEFEAPKLSWNPAISPAGLTYYDAALFPQWRGSLFLGGLSGQALIRVALDGETARKADQWDMDARIRAVEVGPDGALWVLEDGRQGGRGRLWKLTPASR